MFRFCARPRKALGVVKQLRFFYGMLLLAIMVALLPFQFFLNRNPGEWDVQCGPHTTTIMKQFNEDTEQTPGVLLLVMSFAFNGIILFPLLVLSLVYVSYLRRTRKHFWQLSAVLKDRLVKEASEKKQILRDYKIKL